MDALPVPTVTPEWLVAHLTDGDLRILDTRWSLAAGSERGAYEAGHIPGSVFIDLDLELAGPPGRGGRHPLPEPAIFGAAMRRAGISTDSSVVVYDEVTGAAARAWWLLRTSGHELVSVLDGGLSAYLAIGGPLSTDPPKLGEGGFTASVFASAVPATAVQSRQEVGDLVLDARTSERYRGERNPLDPRPGHLPGARSLPWMDLYRNGRLGTPHEIRGRLEELGYREQPVIAYCGSGITACALLLALEAAGVGGLHLYPGSWSEWAGEPTYPVELGS